MLLACFHVDLSFSPPKILVLTTQRENCIHLQPLLVVLQTVSPTSLALNFPNANLSLSRAAAPALAAKWDKQNTSRLPLQQVGHASIRPCEALRMRRRRRNGVRFATCSRTSRLNSIQNIHPLGCFSRVVFAEEAQVAMVVRKGGYTDNEDSWKEEKEESIRRGTWKRWIDR